MKLWQSKKKLWFILSSILSSLLLAEPADDHRQNLILQDCNLKAKMALNETFDSAFKKFYQKKYWDNIILSELRPGICETTVLLHDGRIFAHKRSRSLLQGKQVNTIYLRHREFFFSLMQLLHKTKEILKIRLPPLIFNLETQDNPTCKYPYAERAGSKIKAVKGIIHHSFCSPTLCDGTTLLPISYNQNIAAMEATKKMDSRSASNPWKQRKNKLFWRGSNAGKKVEYNFFNWSLSHLPRAKAVQMCKKKKDADVKFGFVPWELFTKHKYILALAGNTYSSLFKHALRSGSCILRQEERMYEWFEPFLKDWIHFIPVKWDLSDLFAQLEWVKANDDKARQIALQAESLGKVLFSPEIIACYTYYTLVKYHEKIEKNEQSGEIWKSFIEIKYVCHSKIGKRNDCQKIE